MSVEVIHRDAHLLVVCKPSGLPTTSPDGKGCLVEQVQQLDPDAPRLHASSRLDAEVTGLVTFARTPHATQALMAAREQGRYVRHYIALCERPPDPERGEWTWAIGMDPRQPRSRVALDAGSADGRRARTRYQSRRVDERVAVLDLWPQTGRTHQLRVHAAAAHCPLLGDRHYGGQVRLVAGDGRVARAGRVMLHCAELSLPDPSGGATLELHAPVPDDMRALYATLAPDAPPL